jgi:hypothetical protein
VSSLYVFIDCFLSNDVCIKQGNFVNSLIYVGTIVTILTMLGTNKNTYDTVLFGAMVLSLLPSSCCVDDFTFMLYYRSCCYSSLMGTRNLDFDIGVLRFLVHGE